MAQGHSNVRQVGDRIEVLLGELRSSSPPEIATKVEEVVGLLVELYGAGLERILEVVNEDGEGPVGASATPSTSTRTTSGAASAIACSSVSLTVTVEDGQP